MSSNISHQGIVIAAVVGLVAVAGLVLVSSPQTQTGLAWKTMPMNGSNQQWGCEAMCKDIEIRNGNVITTIMKGCKRITPDSLWKTCMCTMIIIETVNQPYAPNDLNFLPCSGEMDPFPKNESD